MKHYLIAFVGVLFLTVGAFAQTKTVTTYGRHEKPADYVKIQSGTMSTGFGAAYNANLQSPVLLGGSVKYFLKENWALRGSLQFGRDFTKSYVKDTNDSGDLGKETNSADYSSTTDRTSTFMVYAGFEHRHKLSNRFFGYYGSDLAIGGSGNISRKKDNTGKLMSEIKTDRACNIALLPFMGIEMFLGPKISLSAECGYSLAFKFYSKNVSKSENTTDKTFPDTSISSNIDFGNSVSAGLRLSYYF